MAKNVGELISLARKYTGMDERRLPSDVILLFTNNIIEYISGITDVPWTEKVLKYSFDRRSLYNGELGDYAEYRFTYPSAAPSSYPAYDTRSVPSNSRGIIRMYVIEDELEKDLIYTPPEKFIARFAQDSVTGSPTHYTVIGDRIRIGPFPDAVYDVYINYYRRPTEITSSSESNEFLNRYWELILYSVLLDSAIYGNEDRLIMLYQPKVERLLLQFKLQVSRRDIHDYRPVSYIPADTADAV